MNNWVHTICTMLLNSCDTGDPINWRPIAILTVMYKLLSRLIYNRLLPTLDHEQHPDQCGFRPHLGIDAALTTVELLLGRAGEWNIPVWIGSLDPRKLMIVYTTRLDYRLFIDRALGKAMFHSLLTCMKADC
eukprot:1025258-Heterocapsa_arctica.AAC.1